MVLCVFSTKSYTSGFTRPRVCSIPKNAETSERNAGVHIKVTPAFLNGFRREFLLLKPFTAFREEGAERRVFPLR